METFEAVEKDDVSDHGMFTTARYQRGEKWSKQQKLLLFVSRKEGVSPGSLTVYTARKTGDTYVVIDGQQRLCAINYMWRHPTTFVLCREPIIACLKKHGVYQTVRSWVNTFSECTMFELREALKNTDGDKSLAKYVEQRASVSNIDRSLASNIQRALLEETDILNISIAFDHYYGRDNADMMSVVFERLNDAGTKLTEWEIAAALFATDVKPLIPKLQKKCDEYILGTKTMMVDFECHAEQSYSLHEFISSICLVLWEEFPVIEGLKRYTQSMDEKVALFNRIFLIIYQKTKFAALRDAIPWNTLEAQAQLLDRFRFAVGEVQAIMERLYTPKTSKTNLRRMVSTAVPFNCFLAHVASFFECYSNQSKLQLLRHHTMGHLLMEIVAGEDIVYPSAHHINHHAQRVLQGHYTYPCDLSKLRLALEYHVRK